MQVEGAYLVYLQLDASESIGQMPAGSSAGVPQAQVLGQKGVRSHA